VGCKVEVKVRGEACRFMFPRWSGERAGLSSGPSPTQQSRSRSIKCKRLFLGKSFICIGNGMFLFFLFLLLLLLLLLLSCLYFFLRALRNYCLSVVTFHLLVYLYLTPYLYMYIGHNLQRCFSLFQCVVRSILVRYMSSLKSLPLHRKNSSWPARRDDMK